MLSDYQRLLSPLSDSLAVLAPGIHSNSDLDRCSAFEATVGTESSIDYSFLVDSFVMAYEARDALPSGPSLAAGRSPWRFGCLLDRRG